MNLRTLSALALLLSTAVAGCNQSEVGSDQLAQLAGNSASCPEAPTPDMDDALPCSLPTGTTCAYRTTEPPPGAPADVHGWVAFTCGCTADGIWSKTYEGSEAECPDEQPEEGTPCDPSKAGTCPYFPGDISSCEPSGTWKRFSGVEHFACVNP